MNNNCGETMHVGMMDRSVTVLCLRCLSYFVLSWLLGLLCCGHGLHMTVPWLGQLISGLSVWRTWFHPRSVHVGFVVDKVELAQVSLRLTWFSNQYHSTDDQQI
jgi:hypothetical protein